LKTGRVQKNSDTFRVGRSARRPGPFQWESVGRGRPRPIGSTAMKLLRAPWRVAELEKMTVFHYLTEFSGLRLGRPRHFRAFITGVQMTPRGIVLTLHAPDRGAAALLSAIFGSLAGRIQRCTQCEDFFLILPGSINQRQCRNCAGLTRGKSPRGGFLGSFAPAWKQLVRRLAKQVERGTLTPAAKRVQLGTALREAREERRRGASPKAWRERWQKRTRRPLGRPHGSRRKGVG
jgi:hypothetical protein